MLKKQRLEVISKKVEQTVLKDCTFKPTISSKEAMKKSLNVDYSKMNSKSIQKFLDRQNEARMRKEKSQEKM